MKEQIEKAKQKVADKRGEESFEEMMKRSLTYNECYPIRDIYEEVLALLEQQEQPEPKFYNLGANMKPMPWSGAYKQPEPSKTAETDWLIPEKPIGDFVLNNAKHWIEKSDGNYYHYSEVCQLLRKYAAQSRPSSAEPSKTAEEVLSEHSGISIEHFEDSRVSIENALLAMRAYAAQSRPSDTVECLEWMLKNGYYRSSMIIDHNLVKGWDNSVHQTKLVDTSQGVYDKFLQEKKGGEK